MMQSYERFLIRRKLKDRFRIDVSTPEFNKCPRRFKEILKNYETFGLIIRVYNYGRLATNELHYVAGTSGLLYCFNGEYEGKWFKYKDRLSLEAAPDGWSIEGYGMATLPEDYLLKHMERHGRFFNKST